MNRLKHLETLGQSIWIDYIKRDMFKSGQLQKLITDDGLRGMTSNPDIFEKAITGSHDYDDSINSMRAAEDDVETIYAALTQQDVQSAADLFLPLYKKMNGEDGYVSLEVNPHLAHDTKGTIAEAENLWRALARPNVFIKVPATKEGLPAIEHLISEGINVNVTLLFGLERYRAVAESYISGLEMRVKKNLKVEHVASVASFFLSRIDALIDPQLENLMSAQDEQATIAKSLHGEVAIASAKMAYQIYKEMFESDRFKALAAKGARPQRLLWASTSTKNKSYSDVKYIDALIGPYTVNTVPMETLDAYRDHGDPKERLETHIDAAQQVFKNLPKLNINIDQITQQLEDEGVDKFNKAYDKLIAALKEVTK